jgi:hypothetical protein
MIEVSRQSSGAAAAQSLLNLAAGARDSEARLANALRRSESKRNAPSKAKGPSQAGSAHDEAALRRVANEILQAVEARLPGRIANLRVAINDDQFVLSGSSNSYYVKQMAQHLAMTALDQRMFGRLTNEIEVRG